MKLYQAIARKLQAIQNCQQSGNREWEASHREEMLAWVADHMPSGSGFDSGTDLSLIDSTPSRLVFDVGFHHMNEHGVYDGWTHHRVIVTPDFCFDYVCRVTGKNRNSIKDHIEQSFNDCLSTDVDCF